MLRRKSAAGSVSGACASDQCLEFTLPRPAPDRAVAASKAAGKTLDWTGLKPIASETPPIGYTKDERRLLLSALRSVVIETLELADIHNDFVGLVVNYSKQRVGLALNAASAAAHGYRGISGLSRGNLEHLTPRFIMLDSLVTSESLIDQSNHAKSNRHQDGNVGGLQEMARSQHALKWHHLGL